MHVAYMPGVESTLPHTNRMVIGSTVILVLVGWVLWFPGPLSLIMPILLSIALWRAVRARSLWAVLFVLANPLSFFFARGVVDYWEGRPALRGMGLPGPEYANLDPATRCFRMSGGCLIRGNEWATILPHNYGIRLMVMIFGPPAGTYDGPYPTREEALAFVSANGMPVSAEQFTGGVIPYPGGEIRIEPGVAGAIGRYLFPISGYAAGEAVEGEELHAALWKERCLILHWRESPEWVLGKDRQDVVVLLDVRMGRPFAVYAFSRETPIRRAAIEMFWK